MLEVKNDLVTLFLSEPNASGNSQFLGVEVNTNPGTVFVRYESDTKAFDGKETLVINEYLENKLKNFAQKELEEWLCAHSNEHDFYTQKNEYGEYSFFKNSAFRPTAIPIEILGDMDISFAKIAEGIIEAKARRAEIVYDIQTHAITIERREDEISPLSLYYSKGKLYERLAIEQYKMGTAHPAFMELVNLNEFLDGKKSVKLVLKDGRVFEFKDQWFDVHSIVNLDGNGFFLNNSYRLKPQLKNKLPIAKLDHLQYAKQSYRINTDNLAIK